MTVTVIEFLDYSGTVRIEVSEIFLTKIKQFFATKGIKSLGKVKTLVTGYDRIKNLGGEMIFEYGDEFYSGEVCCFGVPVIDDQIEYILCENKRSEAILFTALNQ